MTRLELIEKLKKENNFNLLIQAGLVNIYVANWYDIYIFFLQLLNKKKNPTSKDRFACVSETAEYWKICDTTVYRIIKFMEN